MSTYSLPPRASRRGGRVPAPRPHTAGRRDRQPRRRLRLRLNLPLALGLFGLAVLLVMAVFGPAIAPYTPTDGDRIHITVLANRILYDVAPYPPSLKHLLGTNAGGHDLFSLLLYGARWTLFAGAASALMRLVAGTVLGFLLNGRRSGVVLKAAALATSNIPGVLFVLFAMRDLHFHGLWSQAIALTAWVALLDVFQVGETVAARVRGALAQPYVDGAQAVGASAFAILRRHVWPHALPFLVSALALEMARSLWVLGELGLLRLFVGGAIVHTGMFGLKVVSATGEWAGLLAANRNLFGTVPWVPLVPGLAFLFAIVTFNGLGLGLQRRLDRRAGQLL